MAHNIKIGLWIAFIFLGLAAIWAFIEYKLPEIGNTIGANATQGSTTQLGQTIKSTLSSIGIKI